MMRYGIAGGIIVLLAWALVADLRRREVPLPVLAGLGFLALIGRPWPWWVATAAAFLVPRGEWAIYILPLPVLAGVLTGEGAPAIALVAGLVAWAFRWWGGADAALLSVLALRHGVAGLWVGAGALAVGGLAVLALRKRSAVSVLAAALGLLSGKVVAEGDIPAESEFPAAAALAAAGVVLEILALAGGAG